MFETLPGISPPVAYWKQQGECRSLREGGENTRFFHAHESQRLCGNCICALDVDGSHVMGHAAKSDALPGFYSGLFGRIMVPSWAFDMESLYVPISLQKAYVKALYRGLTSRLQRQICATIDEDQSGFIPGRSIMENFIYALEMVQCCFKRATPMLVFKLDFAKAFDLIN
ncbi:hypothetical protein D1007_49139 [Hordeum vulgare]|nr:hypothetical protein D1007_49139 [Hordeum vulgare]